MNSEYKLLFGLTVQFQSKTTAERENMFLMQKHQIAKKSAKTDPISGTS